MASDFVRWTERKTDPATGMDIAFLGKPHRNDPRRLYSQTGADWQMRVDFDRLRRQRLEKLQAEMKKDNLGALVLFAGPTSATRRLHTRATGNTTSTSATPFSRMAVSPCFSKPQARTSCVPRWICLGWRVAYNLP